MTEDTKTTEPIVIDDTTETPPAKAADIEFTAEQQTRIDQIIGERLGRARTSWEVAAAAAKTKAESEAEQAKLTEQAEWQKLAEKHQARVTELEPLEAETAAYAEVIEGMLKAKLKALGDKAQTAVDGLPGDLGALAKLQWLNKNEALFATKPPPDIDALKRGDGTTEAKVTDEQVQEFAVRYGVNPKYVNREQVAEILALGG